jgi:hypothetical protein
MSEADKFTVYQDSLTRVRAPQGETSNEGSEET